MIRDLLLHRSDWDNTAVIEGEKSMTYRVLARKALSLQSRLPQTPGEHVAILLPNGGDYLAAFFGTLLRGMVAFPLSASMTRHEVLPLLSQAGVHTVITARAFYPLFAAHPEGAPPGLKLVDIESLPPDGAPPDAPLPPDSGGFQGAAKIGADEPMVLLGTSGTTGRSKLVLLSENNVRAAVLGYLDKMDFDGIEDIKFLLCTPFSTAYGMMILAVCLMKSFPVVVLRDPFTLDAFYRAVERCRITHYEGGTAVPLMMERMAGRAIPYDISSLRYMAFGGSKVSGRMIRGLYDAYPGIRFYQGYGMTEASPLITKKPEKPDSAGTAITGVTIAIEADGVVTDAPNTRGEILVKGPNVMLRYYQDEEATARALRNGWLHTGDIGYLDEDGDLYLCGRKKNLIIVRGFNVQPEEVEECVLNSALVRDCLVYGREDAFGGEVVCLDAVPANPQVRAEDLRNHCRSRLADYKVPQIVRLRDAIQKNASGKVQRA